MVEWRLGRRCIPERALCSGADCPCGSALVDCTGHAAARFFHGAGAVFALAGDCRSTLWADGIGSRRRRRGYEYQPDGAGAAAIHGTCPEYFLFLWHFSAGGTRADGGLDRIADQPGGWVWSDRRRVCGGVWQRLLADSGWEGCGGGCGLATLPGV